MDSTQPSVRPLNFSQLFSQIDRRKVEVALTALTAVFIAASLATETLRADPGLILILNVLSYVCGGWFGAQKAFGDLREGKFNVDLLMIVSALGAALIDQWHEGATLLFLFSLSNTLQDFAMERSRNAIKALLKLRPNEATVVRDGREIKVSVSDLRVGDHVIIRPGESVAVDGRIVAGRSTLDQASITGESVPVEKGIGEAVFAGTINGGGSLEVAVEKLAADTTLARIIHLVETAQHQRARTQRFLDEFESRYAVGVMITAALLILVPWLVFGQAFQPTFYRAMIVLVVASPCALVISTPASILSAIANGARRGVLFKGGAHLENMADVKVVAFDKTGTLTQRRLRLTNVYVSRANCPPDFAENDLIALAAALESRSEHPIAKAVLAEAKERGLILPEMTHFVALPGRGVHAEADGFLVWIGGYRMFEEHGEVIPPDVMAVKEEWESEGKTVLILHREIERDGDEGVHEDEGGWLGCVAVADSVRADAKHTVAELKRLGIERVVMLTGDNAKVAHSIAEQTGVDEFHADLLPEQKVELLKRLETKYGPVAMVGDGVNDAPALATAMVGVAMGAAGADVALETADVVLMGDSLANIPYAVNLSRRARRVVWQNIAFSLSVIVVLVLGAFGFSLPLPLGVVGHEGSTLIVVANGLRLLKG